MEGEGEGVVDPSAEDFLRFFAEPGEGAIAVFEAEAEVGELLQSLGEIGEPPKGFFSHSGAGDDLEEAEVELGVRVASLDFSGEAEGGSAVLGLFARRTEDEVVGGSDAMGPKASGRMEDVLDLVALAEALEVACRPGLAPHLDAVAAAFLEEAKVLVAEAAEI